MYKHFKTCSIHHSNKHYNSNYYNSKHGRLFQQVHTGYGGYGNEYNYTIYKSDMSLKHLLVELFNFSSANCAVENVFTLSENNFV